MLRKTDLEQCDRFVGVTVTQRKFGEARRRMDSSRVDLERLGIRMGRAGIVAPLGLQIAYTGPRRDETRFKIKDLPVYHLSLLQRAGVQQPLPQVEPDAGIRRGEIGRPLQQRQRLSRQTRLGERKTGQTGRLRIVRPHRAGSPVGRQGVLEPASPMGCQRPLQGFAKCVRRHLRVFLI